MVGLTNFEIKMGFVKDVDDDIVDDDERDDDVGGDINDDWVTNDEDDDNDEWVTNEDEEGNNLKALEGGRKILVDLEVLKDWWEEFRLGEDSVLLRKVFCVLECIVFCDLVFMLFNVFVRIFSCVLVCIFWFDLIWDEDG